MKKLVLMRGVPGSGKSYKAKEIVAQHGQSEDCIASADDFFMVDGEYKFDPDRLGSAHWSCKNKVRELMEADAPLVVVDNTNTKRKEMKAYAHMAKEFGYEVEFAMPETSWAWNADECFKRNTHKVPMEVIRNMLKRFDKKLTPDELMASLSE